MILITGANGFTAKHLVQILHGDKILLSRNTTTSDKSGSKVVSCDLLDYNKLKRIIQTESPCEIYHLAGSFTNEFEVDYNANVKATKNILDCVNETGIKARILLIGSAAEYGLVSRAQCPIDESSPLAPFNVYGLTKIYQKYLMDFYINTFSLNIVMARPFNLYGRNISKRLFIGKLYSEIAKLKKGEIDVIKLGNLNSERDYIHIGEAVKHYVTIMEKGQSGEVYNVGQGVPTKTAALLKMILEEENVSEEVVLGDNDKCQQNDSEAIYADISKLRGLYS